MTWRDLLIGVGVAALALAALALAFAARAVMRRSRAGKRPVWGGLIARGILIASLAWVGLASLVNAPRPGLTNRPAPVAADAIVAFVQDAREGASQTVVGVSARDGATRWTRSLGAIESLLLPTPDIILAQTGANGVAALRLADGAVLWRYSVGANAPIGPLTADGARVYIASSPPSTAIPPHARMVALDLRTGAVVWQAQLPESFSQPRLLVAGDGLAVVTGLVGDTGTGRDQGMVVALSATDGAARWSATVGASAGSSIYIGAVFVAGGKVIVMWRTAGQTGSLVALSERDGSTDWSGPPAQSPNNPPQIFAATAGGGVVYTLTQPSTSTTGATGQMIAPPMSLTALNAGDGRVRWSVTAPASGLRSALALSDGVLLSGVSVYSSMGWAGYSPKGSLLTAYDAASGRALWRDNTPPTGVSWDMSPQIIPQGGSGAVYLMGIESNPYVSVCVVFCPGVSWLYAVNAHTGAPWWRIQMGYATLAHLVF